MQITRYLSILGLLGCLSSPCFADTDSWDIGPTPTVAPTAAAGATSAIDTAPLGGFSLTPTSDPLYPFDLMELERRGSGNKSFKTGQAVIAPLNPNAYNKTHNQNLKLPKTAYSGLSNFGNILPPTSLDSFVVKSGMNDAIYGDEGTFSIPPYFGMNASHTIESGINSGGLTTGHPSGTPSAWLTY